MISSKLDYEKAGLMLKHLSKAQKKMAEKEIAQKNLGDNLDQLRKFSKKKEFRQQIEELENMIGEAIEKEQKIISHQETEDTLNRRLLDRIQRLEIKLGNYMKNRSQRVQRIKELEAKIKNRASERKKDVQTIEQQIALLEKLYHKIRKEGGYTESDLLRVESKIESLKMKLEALKQ